MFLSWKITQPQWYLGNFIHKSVWIRATLEQTQKSAQRVQPVEQDDGTTASVHYLF